MFILMACLCVLFILVVFLMINLFVSLFIMGLSHCCSGLVADSVVNNVCRIGFWGRLYVRILVLTAEQKQGFLYEDCNNEPWRILSLDHVWGRR